MPSDLDTIDRLTVANPEPQPIDRAPSSRRLPVLRTRKHAFSLFAVQEGVRADVAIQIAGAQINAGLNAMRLALCDQERTEESASLWAAFYAIEGGAALVDALSLAIEEAVDEEEEPTAAP